MAHLQLEFFVLMGDGAARHDTALRGAEPCRVMTRQNKSWNLNTFLKYLQKGKALEELMSFIDSECEQF